MALRPLPLAAGARSNPAAFTITLSRLVEPPAQVLRPASSSARSHARTGDDRANELASYRRRYGRSPRASRTAALWRSWRRPVRLARWGGPSGPGGGPGPPGAAGGGPSVGRAWPFVTPMQSYLDTRRTRPFESRLRAAVVASMSMCIDRRWLCAHLVSPGRVCEDGQPSGRAHASRYVTSVTPRVG